MDQPIARLRGATRLIHERIEALPYARAVLDGTLPIDRYGRFLRAVHEVHAALEQAIERAGDAQLRTVFGHAHARRALLERDLAALGVDRHAVDGAMLHALVLAQRMRLSALRDPRELLGHAYVLEGSQLGGLVQHAALSSRLELKHGGLAYLAGSGRDAQGDFQRFLSRLKAALTDPRAVESAIAGALHAFEGFEAILEALDPGRSEERWLTTALNTDAGTHAIPSDVRKVAAALRAGEATWQNFAYYEARYGERGLRFTRSDSAWLATLAREEPAHALRQISWLARVLASRGMPRLLLELHLEQLHDALASALPGERAHYTTLHEGARALRDERLGALPEQEVAELSAACASGLEPEAGISPTEAATLLLAAVADERCRVPDAVASLTSWLAAPTRFSRLWVAQLNRTLIKARGTPHR